METETGKRFSEKSLNVSWYKWSDFLAIHSGSLCLMCFSMLKNVITDAAAISINTTEMMNNMRFLDSLIFNFRNIS